MRSNIYLLVSLVTLIASIVFNIYLYSLFNRVQEQFEVQTKIIEKYDEIDRRIKGGEHDLLEVLETFIDDQAYIVEGKNVSTGDFLLYHNRLKDSLDLYKSFYRFSQTRYGIDLYREYAPDSSYYFTRSKGTTRADSSNVLIDYYRDKLTKKGDTWYIDGDYEENYLYYKKEYDSLNNRLREIIREHNLRSDSISSPPSN